MPSVVGQVVDEYSSQPDESLLRRNLDAAVDLAMSFEQGFLHDAGQIHLAAEARPKLLARQQPQIVAVLFQSCVDNWGGAGHGVSSIPQAEERSLSLLVPSMASS